MRYPFYERTFLPIQNATTFSGLPTNRWPPSTSAATCSARTGGENKTFFEQKSKLKTNENTVELKTEKKQNFVDFTWEKTDILKFCRDQLDGFAKLSFQKLQFET